MYNPGKLDILFASLNLIFVFLKQEWNQTLPSKFEIDLFFRLVSNWILFPTYCLFRQNLVNKTSNSSYKIKTLTPLCIMPLKFIYSEKAIKLCKIFTLLLSSVVPVKSKVTILQNFVAFSEYMNFRLSCSMLV